MEDYNIIHNLKKNILNKVNSSIILKNQIDTVFDDANSNEFMYLPGFRFKHLSDPSATTNPYSCTVLSKVDSIRTILNKINNNNSRENVQIAVFYYGNTNQDKNNDRKICFSNLLSFEMIEEMNEDEKIQNPTSGIFIRSYDKIKEIKNNDPSILIYKELYTKLFNLDKIKVNICIYEIPEGNKNILKEILTDNLISSSGSYTNYCSKLLKNYCNRKEDNINYPYITTNECKKFCKDTSQCDEAFKYICEIKYNIFDKLDNNSQINNEEYDKFIKECGCFMPDSYYKNIDESYKKRGIQLVPCSYKYKYACL